jgi:peptidoglycan hydrolase CwlO-like protein
MADLGKAEWGGIVTAAIAAVGGLWRWLIGRRREEENLDDSRIGSLSKSWKLQEELTEYWHKQFASLRSDIATLKAEHEACEIKTQSLERQNREQAEAMKQMQHEIEQLRAQINRPSLRAV